MIHLNMEIMDNPEFENLKIIMHTNIPYSQYKLQFDMFLEINIAFQKTEYLIDQYY